MYILGLKPIPAEYPCFDAAPWQVLYVADPDPGDPPVYEAHGITEVLCAKSYPVGTTILWGKL